MIRLMIVDDHAIFREGLTSILRQEPEFEIAGVAGTVQEAVAVAAEAKPDMILMDFALPDGTGAEAASRVLRAHPGCKIIFLTISDSDENLFSAIRAGAKGYLLKNMSPSKLVVTIKAVHRGESALSREMTLRLMEELSRTQSPDQIAESAFSRLTPRELDVLAELEKGKSNQEIASGLVLSKNTVKYHVHSILDKLNLSNRRAAAEFAREHKLDQYRRPKKD